MKLTHAEQVQLAIEADEFMNGNPKIWTGEGLPPVGINCDTLWSSTTGEYVGVKVLAHDEDRAVVRFLTGSRKGEYDSDTQHTRYGADKPIFRPIRTSEQIAAEDREDSIKAMTEVIRKAIAYPSEQDASDYSAALYDAGYRKFEGEA